MDGSEHLANCPAEDWAWGLVNNLIRMNAAPNPDAELVALREEYERWQPVFCQTPAGDAEGDAA
jgi:hypothetical protein